VIPRDFECYYCRNNRHERCAFRETCACRICYPQDPYVRFEEGQIAVETLERFLAERQAERQK
jgi:hypothetical protein